MNNRTRSILSALLLIVLSAAIILWKLNIFNLPFSLAGVSTWGLIVAVCAVMALFYSIMDLSFGGIFFSIAVLCIIFDEPLGITALTPWTVLLVALLLTVAFDRIFPDNKKWRKWRKRYMSSSFESSSDDDEVIVNDSDNSSNIEFESKDDPNGYVYYSMKFGSTTKYIRTKNLSVAELKNQFGEMSVFFDGAEVPSGKVSIICHSSFGEMNLFIPKEWHVINKIYTVMGDMDDLSGQSNQSPDAVQCVIDGSVSFGEIKITLI
jgi:predicted membrane protein